MGWRLVNLEAEDVRAMGNMIFLASRELEVRKVNDPLFLLRCNFKASTPKGFDSEEARLVSPSALEWFEMYGMLSCELIMQGVIDVLLVLESNRLGKPARCLRLCMEVGLVWEPLHVALLVFGEVYTLGGDFKGEGGKEKSEFES